MNNSISNPLTCLVMIDNNKKQPVVIAKSHQKPSGAWECVGYVNGEPKCDCTSKDKGHNETEVRKMLAENGYVVSDTKTLAPAMQMKGRFEELVNRLNPDKGRTDAFLSETNTDLRTEFYAA